MEGENKPNDLLSYAALPAAADEIPMKKPKIT